MAIKISILVPIYGVECFIETFAVSLFEQTYEDIEYIFVNDCSPDASKEVLKRVIERYPRRKAQVTIIENSKNRGSGATRSVGLAASTGDFIMYVDSDDKLTTDAVDKLCQQQKRTGADIVSGAFCRLTNEGELSSAILPYHGPKKNMLCTMLVQNSIPHNLCGRLIRKSLHTSNNIDFVEGINMAEDYSVIPTLMLLIFYHRHSRHLLRFVYQIIKHFYIRKLERQHGR